MIVHQPPTPWSPMAGAPTIFLAGSIDMGAATNWQNDLITVLANRKISVLNPRRDDWDSSWRHSWVPLAAVPLPFPSIPLAAAEAVKVQHGHGIPVRLPSGAPGAGWVRLEAEGDLLALAELEPLGRGAVALARPKIVLAE